MVAIKETYRRDCRYAAGPFSTSRKTKGNHTTMTRPQAVTLISAPATAKSWINITKHVVVAAANHQRRRVRSTTAIRLARARAAQTATAGTSRARFGTPGRANRCRRTTRRNKTPTQRAVLSSTLLGTTSTVPEREQAPHGCTTSSLEGQKRSVYADGAPQSTHTGRTDLPAAPTPHFPRRQRPRSCQPPFDR